MNINHILSQIAALHGVPVEAVYRDLQEAIQIGMNSKDPKVHAHWSRISKNGSEVTPEQLLYYLVQTLLNSQ